MTERVQELLDNGSTQPLITSCWNRAGTDMVFKRSLYLDWIGIPEEVGPLQQAGKWRLETDKPC